MAGRRSEGGDLGTFKDDPELDESRDHVGGLGSRLPVAPHSANRRKTFGGSSGHRSTSGSSVGSGTTRSQTDGSEVTSVDFNQGDSEDPFAFGQSNTWPGDYVKGMFKGSSHWSRPRELISEVISQTNPHRPGHSKSKANAANLLVSLRELSAHLSGGYGWPSGADRIEPLCRSLHALFGEFKGREASLFGTKDVGNENKVVRLVYAHLLAVAKSDAAIKHRVGALASVKAAAALSASSASASSSSSSSSTISSSAVRATRVKYSMSEELVSKMLATAEAEMLMHDNLPRRCFATALYASLAVLACTGVNEEYLLSKSNSNSGLQLKSALKQLPSFLRSLVDEGTVVLGPKARPKAKKSFEESQILLSHAAAAAFTWISVADAQIMFTHAFIEIQSHRHSPLYDLSNLFPLSQKHEVAVLGEGKYVPRYCLAKQNDAEMDTEGVPSQLITPLALSALSPVSTTVIVRQAMASLSILVQHYPVSVAAAFARKIVPLNANKASPEASANSSFGNSLSSRQTTLVNEKSPQGASSDGGVDSGVFHGDVLSSIYYLRVCTGIAFASLSCWNEFSGQKANEGAIARTESYAVVVAAMQDARPRIQLEAVHCLFKMHPSSWWRSLEAAVTPPPAHTVMALKEEDLRGIVARAGSPTAAFAVDVGNGQISSSSLANSTAGQAVVGRSLSELQSAVSRGSGGSNHADGLSVNAWLTATTSLHHLMTKATTVPKSLQAETAENDESINLGSELSGGWDRRYHDEIVAHSVCKAAAHMGRCFQSRYRSRNVSAHVTVSELPSTNVSELEQRENERAAIEEQRKVNRNVNSDLLGLADVFLGAPSNHVKTPPPYPVGLSKKAKNSMSTNNVGSSVNALNSNSVHGVQNLGFGIGGDAFTASSSAFDQSQVNATNQRRPHDVGGSGEWVVTSSAYDMSVRTERCLWQVAEFLLFSQASLVSLSNQSSSTQDGSVEKIRSPLLHPSAPWSIRKKALEALIWVAPSNCIQQHYYHQRRMAFQEQQTVPPQPFQAPGSPTIQSAAPSSTAAVVPEEDIPSLLYSMSERDEEHWLLIKQNLLEVGPTLPLACLVELSQELQGRIASDALPATMRLGLQVVVAWFKAAPCDVLGECLRKMWETCLEAASTCLSEIESLIDVPTRRCMYEESRCIVLESLFDVLEWRLVCSRSTAITTDPIVYTPIGIPLMESWQGVGGSPSPEAQWATLLNIHRSAYTILAKYAKLLAGISHEKNTSISSTVSPGGEVEFGDITENDTLSAWSPSETITNIVLRLKRAVLSENLVTRRCCVSGLALLSLQVEDPIRFDIYTFFHDLLKSSHEQTMFSINCKSSSKQVFLPEVNLGVSDLVGAALRQLDDLYSALEVSEGNF